MNNRGRHVGLVLMAWLCMCACTLCVAPRPARADEVPSFVRVKSGAAANLATSLTAKEKKAYQRAYKACLDYANQPSTIEVDVSDLKLTTSQSLRVGYMLHSNGELFWVSTYDDNNFTSKKIVLPCTYTDAQITRMRSQLNKAVNKALAKVKPGMNAMTKILVLHDYLIDRIDYGDHAKTAYDGLVRRKADCFGFTQTMDLVLRRAGFATDVAYNFAGNHSWNLVKAGGKWYHIDLMWDNGYTHDIFWGQRALQALLAAAGLSHEERRIHLHRPWEVVVFSQVHHQHVQEAGGARQQLCQGGRQEQALFKGLCCGWPKVRAQRHQDGQARERVCGCQEDILVHYGAGFGAIQGRGVSCYGH